LHVVAAQRQTDFGQQLEIIVDTVILHGVDAIGTQTGGFGSDEQF
jgi:hypothetical protein